MRHMVELKWQLENGIILFAVAFLYGKRSRRIRLYPAIRAVSFRTSQSFPSKIIKIIIIIIIVHEIPLGKRRKENHRIRL